MFPGLDLCYKEPAQRFIVVDYSLDHLDDPSVYDLDDVDGLSVHDISDLSVDDLPNRCSVLCADFCVTFFYLVSALHSKVRLMPY